MSRVETSRWRSGGQRAKATLAPSGGRRPVGGRRPPGRNLPFSDTAPPGAPQEPMSQRTLAATARVADQLRGMLGAHTTAVNRQGNRPSRHG